MKRLAALGAVVFGDLLGRRQPVARAVDQPTCVPRYWAATAGANEIAR
jgi:hypothetical protein